MDWVDIRNTVIATVVAGVILWFFRAAILGFFFRKREEQRHQIRPILEELWDSLQCLERMVDDFAGEKAVELVNKHIIKRVIRREEGEILANVKVCEGELSFTGMGLSIEGSTTFVLYAPQWVKEGIKRIEDLQKEFRLSVADFNKRWSSGQTLKTLEKRNGSKISDEALEIGKKADFLKKQVVKLKQDIENELSGKKWWCP